MLLRANILSVDKTYFLHREFSFTLKDDIYVRYKCFPDAESFSRELKKECPYKIDIGAVYSLPVSYVSSFD